jgi:Glucodextranase, domain B
MFRRTRYRRGPYALAEPRGVPRPVKALIWLIVLALILWYLIGWILSLFGAGNELERRAVSMSVERGGTVNVSIEGGLMKRTESGVPLYSGDKVSTSGNGHATLTFFEGGKARLDENTDLMVDESVQGEGESAITLTVERGTVWIQTPDEDSFSGAITRTVKTPRMTITVPAHAEAVISDGSILVFSSDGLGLPVLVKGASEPVVIGEGQKFVLPDDANPDGDLYSYRSALDATASAQEFVLASRGETADAGTGATTASMLTVTSPRDGATAEGTVSVQGSVTSQVRTVRVNGLTITHDASKGTFSQTVTVNSADFAITVEALDAQGKVLATVRRTVKRAAASAVPAPGISAPVKTGETYRTTENEIVLRGTNGASITGIMVNEYRLQLFTPGKGTWSYLASTRLGNLKAGENIFNIYALDAQGNKSDPATIIIVYDDGTLTPAPSSAGSTGGSVSSAATQPDETKLPQNDPLAAGTLKVTGPTEGLSHTATGGELLIEGTTSAQTASVWVNGYKLQLYVAGKTYWNYIANEAFGNLKKGTNVYRIVTRDSDNRILDRVEYTVTW